MTILEEFLEPSDEEVLGDPEEDEASADEMDDDMSFATALSRPGHRSSSAEEESDAPAEDEEDLGGWGDSKQDYYNADDIEKEQDALDEEAEARRIQQKHLQSMTAADYGFDEDEWQDAKTADKQAQDRGVVTEVLPQLQIREDMSAAERLKLLKSRYPEFEPLSKDFLHMQEQLSVLRLEAGAWDGRMKRQHGNQSQITPVAITKYRSAAAYTAALTMYFALLTSTADDHDTKTVALSASVIRDHPIMDSLLQCRELWFSIKDIPTEQPHESEPELASDQDDTIIDRTRPEELAAIKAPRMRKTKAQKAVEAAQAASDARRAERLQRTEANLADLDALITQKPSSKRKTSKPDTAATNDNDSDFGEETELTAKQLAEKDKKRKSLRFYTSQIAQKANKRGAAGRLAGGDDDVPHRERLRDRQARLLAEAEKRGKSKKQAGEELGGESDEEDHARARDVRGENDGPDDGTEYYDMIASRSSAKKSEKRALAEAQKQAAAEGGRVVQTEEIGADGKRAIGYVIEKNKGLTPHRKKDVRNPRVKKRKKYDAQKKKLASMKPTYKGGEGRGGYGGELTGIKTGLVKSTKL